MGINQILGSLGNAGGTGEREPLWPQAATPTFVPTTMTEEMDAATRRGDQQLYGDYRRSMAQAQWAQATPQQDAPSAETHWTREDLGNRTIRYFTREDYARTDEIFYQRHPELNRQPLTSRSPAALRSEYQSILLDVAQNRYNDIISRAVGEFRGTEGNTTTPRDLAQRLDPKVLKSLLIHESEFQERVVNQYGYGGLGQFSPQTARASGITPEERFIPEKAIPASARHLGQKADWLEENAFNRYGTPQGDEYMKFVLAAYNGGEATVAHAMGVAYERGLQDAERRGLRGDEAVNYAREYATRWDNLIAPTDNPRNSPLYAATSRFFPRIAMRKYHEISEYPMGIMRRAQQ